MKFSKGVLIKELNYKLSALGIHVDNQNIKKLIEGFTNELDRVQTGIDQFMTYQEPSTSAPNALKRENHEIKGKNRN